MTHETPQHQNPIDSEVPAFGPQPLLETPDQAPPTPPPMPAEAPTTHFQGEAELAPDTTIEAPQPSTTHERPHGVTSHETPAGAYQVDLQIRGDFPEGRLGELASEIGTLIAKYQLSGVAITGSTIQATPISESLFAAPLPETSGQPQSESSPVAPSDPEPPLPMPDPEQLRKEKEKEALPLLHNETVQKELDEAIANLTKVDEDGRSVINNYIHEDGGTPLPTDQLNDFTEKIEKAGIRTVRDMAIVGTDKLTSAVKEGWRTGKAAKRFVDTLATLIPVELNEPFGKEDFSDYHSPLSLEQIVQICPDLDSVPAVAIEDAPETWRALSVGKILDIAANGSTTDKMRINFGYRAEYVDNAFGPAKDFAQQFNTERELLLNPVTDAE